MPTSRNSSCAIDCRFRPAAFAALAALAACTVQAEDSPPNVILVCLDTVGANHVGAYGYDRSPTTPYLDDLASRSTFFADATATAAWTKPSVPSYLTGTYPARHGVYEGSASLDIGEVTDVLPEASLTLAEVFRESGYRTAAFIRNAQLRKGNGFEQGFELYDDEAGNADEILRSAVDWLDARDESRPFFLYLHFLDAHWPYEVPDEYATRFASAEAIAPFQGESSRELRDRVNDGDRPLSPEEREALEGLYDGSVRYLDDRLAEFERGLARRGLAGNTLICVVSDHGEEFGEHGRLGHGHGLWENLLRVVWILFDPGADPERVEDPVSLVDLFPTLLERAGLGDHPGVSRVDGVVRGRGLAGSDRIVAEHKAPDRYQQSVRQGDGKWIRTFTPPAPDTRSTYPVGLGERWEAELDRDASGELVCTQLKPRDEDAGDPLEIKGAIESLGPSELSIGGLVVRFDPQLSAPREEDDPGLCEGRVVKVKADLRDGRYVARRIKFYDPDETSPFELRGPVEALEVEAGEGRLLIAGQWVAVDGATEIKGEEEPRRPPMSREEVVRVVEAGGVGARELGFDVAARTTDLGADPEELGEWTPVDVDAAELRELDRLIRDLGRRRLFGEDDRIFLSREAIDDLRALGYVE